MTMATKDQNVFEPAAFTERGSVTRSTLITERAIKIFHVAQLARNLTKAWECRFESVKIIQPLLQNETAAGHRPALRADGNSE